MSILSELNSTLRRIGVPVETGVFSDIAPDEYIVITPLADTFGVHADDRPQAEVQEARLSLFSKGNYQRRKNRIIAALLDNEYTITDRRYVGFEADVGYHHYAIDVAREYEVEE